MKTPSLKATLVTNAVTSVLAGGLLMAFPGLIGEIMGGVAPWLLQTVGAGLLLFALGVFCVNRKLPASGHWVAWILAFDIAWIAGTPLVMLAYASELSIPGHVLLASVALWVTVFALLERYWLTRIKNVNPVPV